jgi:predicted PurR-regulated permease PerM
MLALLAAAYVAGEIIQPMVFAFILKLLLQRLLRILERRNGRRPWCANFGPRYALGRASFPKVFPAAAQFMRAPIDTLQHFLEQVGNFVASGSREDAAGPLGVGALMATLFVGTRRFASGLFTTVLFLYFLVVSGDTFLRRVEVLPRFQRIADSKDKHPR